MDALRFFIIAVCALGLLAYASSYISALLGLNGLSSKDEYDRIKEYILNDSPLQGNGRPILWVHTIYDINARNWKNTVFRNSSELNQAYLVATVQSIIDKCGDDFHICLIDDASFANLIPTWNETQTSSISWNNVAKHPQDAASTHVHDIVATSDPVKSYLRELGMLQLLYFYGGIRVPNSFLCLKSLMPLYQKYQTAEADRSSSMAFYEDEEDEGEEVLSSGNIRPFVAEIRDETWGPLNVTATTTGDTRSKLNQKHANKHKKGGRLGGTTFVPTAQLMGSAKHSKIVKRWATLLRSQLNGGQFSAEINFNRDIDRSIRLGDVHVIDGRLIGTKSSDGLPIALEQMMSTTPLHLADDAYGVWIPEKKLLQSAKYRWFAHLSYPEILDGKTALSQLFRYRGT